MSLFWLYSVLYYFLDAIESVFWYEPPPVGVATNPAADLTHNIRLLEGSINEPLRWNFSLIELRLVSLSVELNGNIAASIIPSAGLSEVEGPYTSRFSLSWIPNNVILNILTVSAADEGEFKCELLVRPAGEGSSQRWRRNIGVTVVGKLISVSLFC